MCYDVVPYSVEKTCKCWMCGWKYFKFIHDQTHFQEANYRIAGIFRGYKCSRFSPVPQKFISLLNSRRVQYY